jgi:cyclic dehypoxanthinyl futalosine synthase
MGMKIGQLALRFGCNDFGSLMIEENVVSAANTTHRTTVEEMDRLIRDAGFTPARRRQDYTIIAHNDRETGNGKRETLHLSTNA